MCCAKWWPGLPLALYGADAFAWGLETHVFFAQQALLLAAFLAPGLRRAALSFPRLLLAGALLPHLPPPARKDLAEERAGAHDWRTARRYGASERDEERAIAVGYASHLIADEVARAHGIAEPEPHAAGFPKRPMPFERAMDEHVRFAVLVRPGELLEAECAILAAVLASRARWREADARAAILSLARADARAPRLPREPFRPVVPARSDSPLADRLEDCAREVARRLAGIGPQLEARAAAARTPVDFPHDRTRRSLAVPAPCAGGCRDLARA